MGLNVSKTCEIALKEAIRRLQGLNSDFISVRNAEAAGSNPARSTFTSARPLFESPLTLEVILDLKKQGKAASYLKKTLFCKKLGKKELLYVCTRVIRKPLFK
jgi:hypothetical protein